MHRYWKTCRQVCICPVKERNWLRSPLRAAITSGDNTHKNIMGDAIGIPALSFVLCAKSVSNSR